MPISLLLGGTLPPPHALTTAPALLPTHPSPAADTELLIRKEDVRLRVFRL